MRLKKYIFILFLSPAISFAQPQQRISAALQTQAQTATTQELIPVIIVLNDPVDKTVLMRNISSLRTNSDRRNMAMLNLSKSRSFGLNSVSQLLHNAECRNAAKSIRKLVLGNMITCQISATLLEPLQQHPNVKWIDIDREVTNALSITTNRTEYTLSETNTTSWNLDYVEAPRVWKELGITGKGVVVAVLDFGVDYNHPNLQGNMWESPDHPHHGWDFVNDDNDPMEELVSFFEAGGGHGTHCAGVVAGNRTVGTTCGVAPDAQIMAVRVLGKGSRVSSIINGVNFAAENKADVISASLGYTYATQDADIILRRVFDDLALLDIPAIVAAGNSGSITNGKFSSDIYQIIVPGNIPSPWIAPETPLIGGTSSVISVGSVDRNSYISDFSSIGPAFWEHSPYDDYPLAGGAMPGLIKPDIVAPGKEILSLEYKKNTYKQMSGTSMSTPCVAGIVALMKQANSNLSIVQIDRLLQNTATKHAQLKNNIYGSGIVNAYAAVSATANNTPTRLWEKTENGNCQLTWEAPEKQEGLTGYQLYGDGEKIATLTKDKNEYTFSKAKPYKSYYATALYGTTESPVSNVVVDKESIELYAPSNPIIDKTKDIYSVQLKWHSPYENTVLSYGNSDDLILDAEIPMPIHYIRTVFPPEKLVEIACHNLKQLCIYTCIDNKMPVSITVMNGNNTLYSMTVDVENDIIIDLSEVSTLLDHTQELTIDLYSQKLPDYSNTIVACSTTPRVEGVNYYSEDGKTWKEADFLNSNWAIKVTADTKLISSTATVRPAIGYNIYHNGEKINDQPFMGQKFTVSKIEEGTHTFQISSLVNAKESPLTQKVSHTVDPIVFSTPTPTLAIAQQGKDVHLKWDYTGDINGIFNVYQDDICIANKYTKELLIEDVTPGIHTYRVDRANAQRTKMSRGEEQTFEMQNPYRAPSGVVGESKDNKAILTWDSPVYALWSHDGTYRSYEFIYTHDKKITDYYIATNWNSGKLLPFVGSKLKAINLVIGAMDNIHLYIYKNGVLYADQPVTPPSKMGLVTVLLDTPVEILKDDHLRVAFKIKDSKLECACLDRSSAINPEDHLFSLDGITWEPVSKYTSATYPSTMNWLVTLFFDNGKQFNPYSPLPTHFLLQRNDQFAGLTTSHCTSFADELTSHGIYSYTVEAIFPNLHRAKSDKVEVEYNPLSVEEHTISWLLYTVGKDIIIPHAEEETQLYIYNTEGKLIMTRSINKGKNVIRTQLPANYYIVNLRIGQQEKAVKVQIQ